MQVSREIERYPVGFMYSSFPGLRITTSLTHFHMAGRLPVRTTDFTTSMIRFFSHFQSRCTVPQASFSGPGAFPIDSTNRAHSTACPVTEWCTCPTGGSSKYWLCSIGEKNSHLSISSFSVIVFACIPSLPVRALTVPPARGLANFTALLTLAPLGLFRELVHILSFALRIDCYNSALAWDVAADLRLLFISLPSWLLLSLILPFHNLFD